MQGYIHTGPVDCNKSFDTQALKGKTMIVTGGIFLEHHRLRKVYLVTMEIGANGLGEAYVRALVATGYSISNHGAVD